VKRFLPLVAGLAVAAIAFAVLPGDRGSTTTTTTAAAAASSSGGRDVFAKMGCGSCHTLKAAGSTGQIGPNLDEKLPNHTATSLHKAIVSPPVGSIMPDNFATRMTPAELDALVSYLMTSSSQER
jgi:mono/diheme cytochrome c family protein